MEIPEPKEKEKEKVVEETREIAKKVNKVEPKKEKLIDRIIKLLRINELWIHERPI